MPRESERKGKVENIVEQARDKMGELLGSEKKESKEKRQPSKARAHPSKSRPVSQGTSPRSRGK